MTKHVKANSAQCTFHEMSKAKIKVDTFQEFTINRVLLKIFYIRLRHFLICLQKMHYGMHDK